MATETQTILDYDTARRVHVTFTAISDGIDESGSTKVDIGQFNMPSARSGDPDQAVGSFVVEKIKWTAQGYNDIRLFWDTAEDNYILAIPVGGVDSNGDFVNAVTGEMTFGDVGLIDPAAHTSGAAGTGNIALTTTGAVSGATYTISLWLHKKEL